MEFSSIFILGFGFTYIACTIYFANQRDALGVRGDLLRWLLYGAPLLASFYALMIFQVALIEPADPALALDGTTALLHLVLTAVFSFAAISIVVSERLRELLRRTLPESAAYKPTSAIHTTALVLMLMVLWMTLSQFILGGGLAGLAESFQAGGVRISEVLLQQIIWIFAALLGVGMFLRRTPMQTALRLGLRFPTRQDINWGVGAGLLLFAAVIAVSIVWASRVSPQELEEQTAASSQLARSFDTLGAAFVVSGVVSFGEEIFFRGALQPIFGIPLTSIYFALLHTQYALTPATVVIIITAFGLGWLRQRYSTTAAIIAHFVYNFIQLALAVLVGSSL